MMNEGGILAALAADKRQINAGPPSSVIIYTKALNSTASPIKGAPSSSASSLEVPQSPESTMSGLTRDKASDIEDERTTASRSDTSEASEEISECESDHVTDSDCEGDEDSDEDADEWDEISCLEDQETDDSYNPDEIEEDPADQDVEFDFDECNVKTSCRKKVYDVHGITQHKTEQSDATASLASHPDPIEEINEILSQSEDEDTEIEAELWNDDDVELDEVIATIYHENLSLPASANLWNEEEFSEVEEDEHLSRSFYSDVKDINLDSTMTPPIQPDRSNTALSNFEQNASVVADQLIIASDEFTSEEKSVLLNLGHEAVCFADHTTNKSGEPVSEEKTSLCLSKSSCQDSVESLESSSHQVRYDFESKEPSHEGDSIALKEEMPLSRSHGIVKRGKWVLGSKIASGAFGVVSVGMNTLTGTLMAVKNVEMGRAILKDLRREVELLRQIQHENVVRYYGAEMNETNLYIFQEWVAGGSVTEMLSRFGSFSLEVIRSYTAQALTGLQYLHSIGILHRDIKGSNILVSDDGIVKLADFGASRKLAIHQADMMMSLTMRGTPYFMAPEVFEEKYSSKADIWSVGCVVIQMATGTPPWKELGYTNPVALFNFIKSHVGLPAMVLPSSENHLKWNEPQTLLLGRFLTKCFDKSPANRPSASELLQDSIFIEFHHDIEAETPNRNSLSSPNSHCSDHFMSPLPKSCNRRNSGGQSRSPFLSPPLPQLHFKASPLPPRSPMLNSNDWPVWARQKVAPPTSFEKDSPLLCTSMKSLNMTDSCAPRITTTMGSLQYSEDSSSARGQASRLLSGSSMKSPLQGIQLLESMGRKEL